MPASSPCSGSVFLPSFTLIVSLVVLFSFFVLLLARMRRRSPWRWVCRDQLANVGGLGEHQGRLAVPRSAVQEGRRVLHARRQGARESSGSLASDWQLVVPQNELHRLGTGGSGSVDACSGETERFSRASIQPRVHMFCFDKPKNGKIQRSKIIMRLEREMRPARPPPGVSLLH